MSKLKDWMKRNPYLVAFILGVIIITGIRPLMRKIPEPPQVISAIYNFSLLNQFGETFGSKQLEGKVYVANFIFTSCKTVCPLSTQKMKTLKARFEEANIDMNFVSFSVDPETDTPDVLQKYAQENNAEKPWYFLTGSQEAVEKSLESFLLSLEPKKVSELGIMDIAHSTKFALVDAKGGLRGFYSSDDSGMDELFHRTTNLVRYFDAGKVVSSTRE